MDKRIGKYFLKASVGMISLLFIVSILFLLIVFFFEKERKKIKPKQKKNNDICMCGQQQEIYASMYIYI